LSHLVYIHEDANAKPKKRAIIRKCANYSASPLEFLIDPFQPVGGSNPLPMLSWESPAVPDVLAKQFNGIIGL